MPDQTPEPGPDEEQTASGRTGPRFAWVPGSADTGLAPVPGSEPGPARPT